MNNYPLITILIASYNRLEFLKNCLESCVVQDANRFDILVIDDGSGQITKDWLLDFSAENKLLSVYCQKNMGVGFARQKGLD